MSTETSGGDKSTASDEEQNLELTLMAYPDPENIGSGEWRKLASEAMPETDWYEETTRTSETHFLRLPPAEGEDEGGDRIQVADASEAQAIAARRTDVTVETDVEESTSKTQSRYNFSRDFREALLDEVPDQIGDLELDGYQYTLDGECVCSITASVDLFQSRLKQRDERTDDDRYENVSQTPALNVSFDIGPAPSESVSEWKDEIVAEVMPILGRWSGIQKVRVAECQVTKKGDCFV